MFFFGLLVSLFFTIDDFFILIFNVLVINAHFSFFMHIIILIHIKFSHF